MSAFALFSLQKGLYDALTGDSALMALISGVYDYAPENSAYPYVTLGEGEAADLSNLRDQAVEAEFRLSIWSRAAGRKQALEIMEAAYDRVMQGFTVSGYEAGLPVFIQGDVRKEQEALAHRGTLRFRVVLTETGS